MISASTSRSSRTLSSTASANAFAISTTRSGASSPSKVAVMVMFPVSLATCASSAPVTVSELSSTVGETSSIVEGAVA
jgi:hypothetical protein